MAFYPSLTRGVGLTGSADILLRSGRLRGEPQPGRETAQAEANEAGVPQSRWLRVAGISGLTPG